MVPGLLAAGCHFRPPKKRVRSSIQHLYSGLVKESFNQHLYSGLVKESFNLSSLYQPVVLDLGREVTW
jgi:hypothetical protein